MAFVEWLKWGEREGETDRQIERQRESERDREGETDRETKKERHIDRQIERQREIRGEPCLSVTLSCPNERTATPDHYVPNQCHPTMVIGR